MAGVVLDVFAPEEGDADDARGGKPPDAGPNGGKSVPRSNGSPAADKRRDFQTCEEG